MGVDAGTATCHILSPDLHATVYEDIPNLVNTMIDTDVCWRLSAMALSMTKLDSVCSVVNAHRLYRRCHLKIAVSQYMAAGERTRSL